MIPLARNGDIAIGICPCHKSPRPVTGVVMATAVKSNVEGLPVARVGDTVIADCGHIAVILGGSAKTIVEGKPAGQVGSSVSGDWMGTILNGAVKSTC